MLNEQQRRKLETKVVELILSIRAAYLSEQGGRPPMNYWEQFSSRMQAAARQTVTASEWASQVQRRLQVGSLRSSDAPVLLDLVRFCDEHDAHLELLDMVSRDTPLLIAMTQEIVEKRKEERDAANSL